MPIINEITKPRVTSNKSLSDILRAYLRLLDPDFLKAREISLPANSPTKHQVVLIGILLYILKTNKIMLNKRSTKVASGTSLILLFSLTIS